MRSLFLLLLLASTGQAGSISYPIAIDSFDADAFTDGPSVTSVIGEDFGATRTMTVVGEGSMTVEGGLLKFSGTGNVRFVLDYDFSVLMFLEPPPGERVNRTAFLSMPFHVDEGVTPRRGELTTDAVGGTQHATLNIEPITAVWSAASAFDGATEMRIVINAETSQPDDTWYAESNRLFITVPEPMTLGLLLVGCGGLLRKRR